MDWNNIAPMVVLSLAVLTTGGVLVLRPIAKRLGSYLEQATLDKQRGAGTPTLSQQQEKMMRLLESLETRLTRLEERVTFSEAVLLHRGAGDATPLRAASSTESPALPERAREPQE